MGYRDGKFWIKSYIYATCRWFTTKTADALFFIYIRARVQPIRDSWTAKGFRKHLGLAAPTLILGTLSIFFAQTFQRVKQPFSQLDSGQIKI